MIEIVSATRLSEADFWTRSALGNSLRRLGHDRRLVTRVAFDNRRGLAEVYNARLLAADSAECLVFVHDDVWLDDAFLADRILDGLQRFDVIGVAGNRRRLAGQTAWAFIDDRFTWDQRANLSGCVGHGKQPFGPLSWFGPSPAECELLDGVLLAARKPALAAASVRFDPRFDFHFYDVDFCRSARAAGLRLGTWPIAITHESGGAFGTAQWNAKRREYLEKWRD
ncbi:MAG: hypothetical protein EOP92_41730 [Lysobacteraceae bacterium]|nr:MAG: hypothetical protein EOP92_41730 [Xanthomonadaceae bacterium]